MQRMSRLLATITCFTVLALPQLALACPGCKDNLTEQHVRAYGWSIIFMMSMPFLILGSLSAYFYYEVCKARKLQAKQNVASYDLTAGPVPTCTVPLFVSVPLMAPAETVTRPPELTVAPLRMPPRTIWSKNSWAVRLSSA